MSKISLTNLVNLENETTAVNAINANNAVLTTAMDKTLSRDGTTPNTMTSSLDMNSNRIVNLPSAVSSSEPVTLLQMAGAILPTGLTGVPVSAAMQPVLNQATTALAQTAMGIPAIGAGLNDTSGVRSVRFPTTAVTTNQVVTSSFHMKQYLATGPMTFTLPLANTLYNGFGFWVYAYSGIVTVTPNGADNIQRGTNGASISIGAGTYAFITTDGVNSWAVQISTAGGGTTSSTFNVKSFGAVGNGTVDDTAAIQAAINAAQAIGGCVYAPTGSYKTSSVLSITSHITFYGDGFTKSSVFPGKGTVFLPSISNSVFSINSQEACTLRDFQIFWGSTPSAATCGILLDSTGGGINGNTDTTIENIGIVNPYVGFKTNNAYTFNLTNVRIDGASFASCYVQNINVPGSGDSVITNCVFSGQPNPAHIFILSAGGLRIENNKLNGGQYGIFVQASSSIAQGLSPFFIVGNSIEGSVTNTGILIQRIPGASYVVGNMVIANNEVGAINIQIAPDGTNPWVNQGVISGNFVYAPSGALISVSGASDINITGNQLFSLGAVATGVAIASCTRVVESANNRGLNVT